MAVKIRLRRMGQKKAPFYRIVVADSRCKRDGRCIAVFAICLPSISQLHFPFKNTKLRTFGSRILFHFLFSR